MKRNIAYLRKAKLLTLEERNRATKCDYHQVLCENSVGEKICILFFHNKEIEDVIVELNTLLDKGFNGIYPKTNRTVAYTLATFLSFKIKRSKGIHRVRPLPHHKELDKIPLLTIDSKTYLLIDHNTGYYKIGRSKNPEKREKTLQSEKPNIELICICKVNIEKELHKKYMLNRIRGEWFFLSNQQIAEIKQLFFEKEK